MSCLCGPWEKRSVEGEMRICSVSRRTRGGQTRKRSFGVAVQRDQKDRRLWESIEKVGIWPSELIAGGFETMDEAKASARGRIHRNCERIGMIEFGGARRRR